MGSQNWWFGDPREPCVFPESSLSCLDALSAGSSGETNMKLLNHSSTMITPLKMNILHIIMEVWFRSCSFLFIDDLYDLFQVPAVNFPGFLLFL